MKLRNKKTGKVVDVWSFYDGDDTINIKYFTDDGQVDHKYNSLAELNEEWEDYEPKEPLIKDEKIRKAVRAWAEAVGQEETFIVSYSNEYHDCCIYVSDLGSTATIDIGIDLNIKEGSYTITELCGEN